MHSTHYTVYITQYAVHNTGLSHAHEMCNSGDGEFSRYVVDEIWSSGDGSLRDGKYTRWEFHEMGRSADG